MKRLFGAVAGLVCTAAAGAAAYEPAGGNRAALTVTAVIWGMVWIICVLQNLPRDYK